MNDSHTVRGYFLDENGVRHSVFGSVSRLRVMDETFVEAVNWNYFAMCGESSRQASVAHLSTAVRAVTCLFCRTYLDRIPAP